MKPVLMKCKKCQCFVEVRSDGKLAAHGPGPNDEFICPGSGDKGLVKAARNLKVPKQKE